MANTIFQIHIRGGMFPLLSGQVSDFAKLGIAIRSKCPASHSDVYHITYSVGSFIDCELKSDDDFNTMLVVAALFPPPLVHIKVTTLHDLFGTIDTCLDNECGFSNSNFRTATDYPCTPKNQLVGHSPCGSSQPHPQKTNTKQPSHLKSTINLNQEPPKSYPSAQSYTAKSLCVERKEPKKIPQAKQTSTHSTGDTSSPQASKHNKKKTNLLSDPANTTPYKCLEALPKYFTYQTESEDLSYGSWANTVDSIVDGQYVTHVSEPLYNEASTPSLDVQSKRKVTVEVEQLEELDEMSKQLLARQEAKELRAKNHSSSKKARLDRNRRGEWYPGVLTDKPSYDYARIERDKPLLSDQWLHHIVGIGQEFKGGVLQFRHDLSKYASKVGFHYSFSRNDAKYVHVYCKMRDSESCGWFVHAALERVTESVFIKSANMQHNCTLSVMRNDTSRLSAALIGELIQDKLRGDPEITAAAIKKEILDVYGFNLTYMKAWRGVESAKSSIFGSYRTSFNELRWYSEAIRTTNPGSIVALEVQPGTNKFQRFFCAFHGSLQAFRSCRPMLFIDGTFMNNRYKGTILAATAKDGNQGLLPVAFAIVESENTTNWVWFINLVREHVQHEEEILYISDRAGGILAAFDALHQRPHHFFCLWHLMKNLREKFPTKSYSNFHRNTMCKLLKEVAYAPTMHSFEKALTKFHNLGKEISRKWLADIPFDRWCLAFSPQLLRYGELTSNAAESFNGAIVIARGLPCTYMVDLIRAQLMKWFVERREAGLKHTGALTETMEDRWNKFKGLQASWTIRTCQTDTEFEVLSRPSTTVHIKNRTCTCWEWQVDGFPCPHAIAVITRHRLDVRDIIDPYYFSDTYKQVYRSDIHPIPTTAKFDVVGLDELPEIQPPNLKKLPGRPKEKRFRKPKEPREKQQICPRCGEWGRHAWTICSKALDP